MMSLKEIFNNKKYSWWAVLITLVFYFAGAFLMKDMDVECLKKRGLAKQEEYTYVDSEGEEREGETLIEIKDIGSVLTYKNVYMAPLVMWFFFLIVGKIILNEEGVNGVIFGNCVLGCLLIFLTSTENILSTILYWLGILSAGLLLAGNRHEKDK